MLYTFETDFAYFSLIWSYRSYFRRLIAHDLLSTLAVPVCTQNLRCFYWWNDMKGDIADFVARCLVCQQVKAEHQRPVGLFQRIPISEWKWEHITMDFVVGLLRTR